MTTSSDAQIKSQGECDDLEGSITATAISNSSIEEARKRGVHPNHAIQFQQPALKMELKVSEKESAKMLIILNNGEQRLITFTLPEKICTVQELLDQMRIPSGADSNIECIKISGSEIDYIVKIGNLTWREAAPMAKAAENYVRQQHQCQQLIQTHKDSMQS